MALGWPQFIVILVVLQRLGELALSRHNEARLRAAGAVEHGARHHILFVLLHAAWLTVLFVFTPPDARVHPVWLLVFVGLQGLRGWVLMSLGRRWSTRVLVLPNAPLVRHGPYRWIRHPNYLIVFAEILVLPLVFGQLVVALVFSVLNAALLAHRIRVEDTALSANQPSQNG